MLNAECGTVAGNDRRLSTRSRHLSCDSYSDKVASYKIIEGNEMILSPGFTLLELLLVLIIVSLMFSTLFIALENPLLRGDLKLAGRMIVNEVTRARAEAAYTNKDLALRFNLEKNLMYQVDLKPTAQGGFENQEEILMRSKALPPGVLLMDLVIGAREKIQFGEADVRVFGNGTMDRALIHIRDEDNDVLTLTLNPLTGDVTIQEGYVDERKL